MLNEISWRQTKARFSAPLHKLLELIKWSVIFSFHHHLKCLLSSHVILQPHFTLGIELWACELNQIYKGQRSKNQIVIDFSLYHKLLDVATLMSNTLDVSILMIPEGANRAMVTSPSCKVRPLRLHRNHSGSQSVAEENFQGSNIWSSGDGTVCCRLHCWHSRTGQLAHASPAKISPGPIMVGCWCVPNWQDQQNGNSCPSNSSSWKVAT